MGVESPDTIYDLNRNWPEGPVDSRREGDNHIRNIKGAILDTLLMDVIANRPAAGTEDRLFFSTDERVIYRDDGTNWVPFSSGVKGETVSSNTTLEAIDYGAIIFVDTSSSDITITLPAEATAGEGWYVIFIKTSASNSMIIEDDASSTLGTYTRDEAAVLTTTDATDWYLIYWAEAQDDLDTLANSHASRYRSVDQSVSSLVWSRVALNAELYDPGGNFSNYKYTAPADGKYLICAQVTTTTLGSGDDLRVALYKNGSLYKYIHTDESASSPEGAAGAVILSLSASDYIELYAKIENGNVDGGNDKTWMQVARLA